MVSVVVSVVVAAVVFLIACVVAIHIAPAQRNARATLMRVAVSCMFAVTTAMLLYLYLED